MAFWQLALLVAAGFMGGLANAMAGGATLFTFPALLTVGLTPVVANATNSFALLPGNSLGAYVDRSKLPMRDIAFGAAVVIALVGGVIGALLLLFTSPAVFALLVPALIAMATGIFAFSSPIKIALAKAIASAPTPRLRLAMLFLAAIYNGFFGAGVGVVFIAVLSATGSEDLRTANAFKNALAFISNLGGLSIFVLNHAISWHFGLAMMAGAAAGGYAGGRLVQVLPSRLVRAVIVFAGCAMTITYAYRYWL